MAASQKYIVSRRVSSEQIDNVGRIDVDIEEKNFVIFYKGQHEEFWNHILLEVKGALRVLF